MNRYRNYEVLVLKEVETYLITDVKYDLDKSRTERKKPITLSSKTIVNRTVQAQTTTLSHNYTTAYSHNWGKVQGLVAGVKTEIHCGVPFVLEATGKVQYVNMKACYSHVWGEDNITTECETISAQCNTPAKKEMKVEVIAAQMEVKLPYTARVVRVYTSRVCSKLKSIVGVYHGIHTTSVTVEYGNPAPL